MPSNTDSSVVLTPLDMTSCLLILQVLRPKKETRHNPHPHRGVAPVKQSKFLVKINAVSPKDCLSQITTWGSK